MVREPGSEKIWKPPESVRMGRVPAHEAVEPAEAAHGLGAGAQQQVVGVAEDDLDAERVEVGGGEPGHRPARPDRHEGGRLHPAVRRGEGAAAGAGLGVADPGVEGEWHGAAPV